MAPYAKMVDLGDIGAALRNLPSPQKPEEELGDEPDPMWVMTLGHSGSIKSVLEDWTRYGSKSPRASFFRWAARDHISSPVQANFHGGVCFRDVARSCPNPSSPSLKAAHMCADMC